MHFVKKNWSHASKFEVVRPDRPTDRRKHKIRNLILSLRKKSNLKYKRSFRPWITPSRISYELLSFYFILVVTIKSSISHTTTLPFLLYCLCNALFKGEYKKPFCWMPVSYFWSSAIQLLYFRLLKQPTAIGHVYNCSGFLPSIDILLLFVTGSVSSTQTSKVLRRSL
jgi:hypothetical protein